MVSLTWLNVDFVRLLEICLEFIRVVDVLDFQQPPPEYTFRGLEPLYVSCIEHFQERCQEKHREITSGESSTEGEVEEKELRERKFDELKGLLQKHSRLLANLESAISHPYLHPRKHSDNIEKPPEVDLQLGPERYLERPFKGYGFSNDYIRQWLAAVPGPFGRHFETEEAGSVNLTKIFQQIVLAMAAGASLLVPMIIMTFNRSQTARLIVVCVATILFGIAFAIVSRSKENILGGTAAYAAVMVVYIGSASPEPIQ